MQTFNIDISRKSGPIVLYAKQGDSLSRFFKIIFFQDGAPWEPPAGALFSVRFGAPGMPDGWYDTIKEPDGSTHSAFSLKDNALTVELAYEAVSKAGTNTLCILVLDANGYQLGAWNLRLDVELTPGENSPEVDVYYSLLSEQVAQVLQAKDDAQASAILSQSWAVGGTSSRAGEDANNSKYWAGQAQAAAQESLGFRTFFGAVRPDLNGDLDPSSPMFAGTGVNITVRSAANRIENVTSHGFTEQAGTGDASPVNQRPITVGGKLWLEYAFTGEEAWKISANNMIYNAPVTMVEATRTNGQCSDVKWISRTDLKVNGTPGIATCSVFNIIVNHPDYFTNVEAWKAYLKKRYTEGNPFKVWVTPSDSSKATGLYTPQISDGESYHCNCIELQQCLCDGDTLDSSIPSGCDKAVVFDGSEDELWKVTGNGFSITNPFPNAIPAVSNQVNKYFYCNRLCQKAQTGSTITVGTFCVNQYAGNNFVWVNIDNGSDLSAFKSKLSKNPLIFYYRSTEYCPEKDERVCMEKHTTSYIELDGTEYYSLNPAGYFVVTPYENQMPNIPAAGTTNMACSIAKPAWTTEGKTVYCLGDSRTIIFGKGFATEFGTAEAFKAKIAALKAAGTPAQLVYRMKSPLTYAQPAVDLPADPIATATQAILPEFPTPDTPALLAQQGELSTYTVSGEKNISLYIKALIKDGDAATLGGKPPEYFLPADQPAVSAPKSTGTTFSVGNAKIFTEGDILTIRNKNTWGAGVSLGLSVDSFQAFFTERAADIPTNLGTTVNRWRTGYFQNQPDISSDGNLKEQVAPLSEKHMLFFDALNPVQYKLKGGSHDRLHYGFIAQEVEQAMAAAGISDMEFGGFCKDRKIRVVQQYSESGKLLSETVEQLDGYEYSLRYGEFIALNTAAIQSLKKEISDLKAEINKLKGV